MSYEGPQKMQGFFFCSIFFEIETFETLYLEDKHFKSANITISSKYDLCMYFYLQHKMKFVDFTAHTWCTVTYTDCCLSFKPILLSRWRYHFTHPSLTLARHTDTVQCHYIQFSSVPIHLNYQHFLTNNFLT